MFDVTNKQKYVIGWINNCPNGGFGKYHKYVKSVGVVHGIKVFHFLLYKSKIIAVYLFLTHSRDSKTVLRVGLNGKIP